MTATNCTTELVSLAMTTGTPRYLSIQAIWILCCFAALPLNWIEGYLADANKLDLQDYFKTFQKVQRGMIYVCCLCYIRINAAHIFRHLTATGCEVFVKKDDCDFGTFLMDFAMMYLHLSNFAMALTFYPYHCVKLWRDFRFTAHFVAVYVGALAFAFIQQPVFSAPSLPICSSYEMHFWAPLWISLIIDACSIIIFAALNVWLIWNMRDPVLHLQISRCHRFLTIERDMHLLLRKFLGFWICFVCYQVRSLMVKSQSNYLDLLEAYATVPIYFCVSPLITVVTFLYWNRDYRARNVFIVSVSPFRVERVTQRIDGERAQITVHV